jgi:hypothetical protein
VVVSAALANLRATFKGLDMLWAEKKLPPACDNCGRRYDDDGEPIHRQENDYCSDCNWAHGMQHFAMYADRDKWWAQGGHCLCDECAPRRESYCVFCQEDRAERDQPYCRPCAVDLAHDLAIDEEITHYGPYGREEE